MAGSMAIAADTVAQIFYALSDEEGKVIERSEKEPMSYLHGHGQIIPGLEAALEGKQAGDHVDVSVPPEQAYGEKTGKTLKVRKSQFPGPVPTVGQSFGAPMPDGGQVAFWVIKDQGAYLTITPDHPFAGRTLNFTVDVVGVRAATSHELAGQQQDCCASGTCG